MLTGFLLCHLFFTHFDVGVDLEPQVLWPAGCCLHHDIKDGGFKACSIFFKPSELCVFSPKLEMQLLNSKEKKGLNFQLKSAILKPSVASYRRCLAPSSNV